jgi:hypothetical protein
MKEQESDSVELPGVPPIDRLGGWDSTVELPKRRVSLPIEMRIARNREAMLWFWVFGAVPFTFLILLVLWIDVETFVSYGYCTSKNGARHTGLGCIPILLIIALALSFLLGGLCRFTDAIIVARNAKAYRAPHVRVDRDAFWHVQLTEPLRFENVLEITDDYGEICLNCATPPKLAFWSWSNRRLWSGKDTKFYFLPVLLAPSLLLPKSNSELLDTITFLVKEHRLPKV